MNSSIIKSIDVASTKPGVYLFKDDKQRILYVGKARDLRARLRSYVNPSDAKTLRLVECSHSVETIITKTEEEALILEDALVKQNQPKYNVRLRDDKRYPMIKITVSEEYPRLEVVRKVDDLGDRYFGPYTDAGSVRKVVALVAELFGVRTCKYDLRRLERPCIRYSMGKCAAPHLVIGKKEYDERVRQACEFLGGRYGIIKKKLVKEIKNLSETLDYEKAHELKERLDSIESISHAQDVSNAKLPDMDVLGYALLDGKANISKLKIRDSKVVALLHYPLKGEYVSDEGMALAAFIKQHYVTGDITPKLVVTSCLPDDKGLLESTISESVGHRLDVVFSRRGQKRKLAEMAVKNSIHQLKMSKLTSEAISRLDSLKKTLRLSRIPNRIEGYDISNIGEKHTVGGMVLFTDGKKDSGGYRRFQIREFGQDDPRNMAEMIKRRFTHREWIYPDLVLLDGGKPQLNACIKHIPEGVVVLALSKKMEEIYVPGRRQPIRLAKEHPGLHVLQQVRDEAHRFARSYHRKKRAKEFIY